MSLKYLLSPEKSTRILHLFHKSSYALIPLGGLSYMSYTVQPFEKFPNGAAIPHGILYGVTAVNYGFHSLVSTSFIITDYIKQPLIRNVVRVINTKFHGIALVGYLHYLVKKYK